MCNCIWKPGLHTNSQIQLRFTIHGISPLISRFSVESANTFENDQKLSFKKGFRNMLILLKEYSFLGTFGRFFQSKSRRVTEVISLFFLSLYSDWVVHSIFPVRGLTGQELFNTHQENLKTLHTFYLLRKYDSESNPWEVLPDLHHCIRKRQHLIECFSAFS